MAGGGHELLEVKVMWGGIVLDVRQFEAEADVTVGDVPGADIRIATGHPGGEPYTLPGPAGPGEQARVEAGQLAFVVRHVAPARGVHSGLLARADRDMAKWLAVVLVLAMGFWVALRKTPAPERETSAYLKNPARFAQLLVPSRRAAEKKTFERIEKKAEEAPVDEDRGKWKHVAAKYKKTESRDVPRDVRREQNHTIATSAGILGLLKKRGGGSGGDNASSVFGGSGMTSLDQQLEDLSSPGMRDSGGFGSLGTRGGPGGGAGLGLGGEGTFGDRPAGGPGYDSIQIAQRGRRGAEVGKGPGPARIVGGLPRAVVGRIIQRYWSQLKYCYEQQLGRDPNLYGKITVTFTIGAEGRVTEAQILQSTMHDTNVEQCVLRTVRRIRFPVPRGGGQVIVTYPFMFTTAG